MYEKEIKEFVANLSKEKIVRDIQDELEWWRDGGDYGDEINNVLYSISIEDYIDMDEEEIKKTVEEIISEGLNIFLEDHPLPPKMVIDLIYGLYYNMVAITTAGIINSAVKEKLCNTFIGIDALLFDFWENIDYKYDNIEEE